MRPSGTRIRLIYERSGVQFPEDPICFFLPCGYCYWTVKTTACVCRCLFAPKLLVCVRGCGRLAASASGVGQAGASRAIRGSQAFISPSLLSSHRPNKRTRGMTATSWASRAQSGVSDDGWGPPAQLLQATTRSQAPAPSWMMDDPEPGC